MRAFSQRGSRLTVTSISGRDMFAERVGRGVEGGVWDEGEGGIGSGTGIMRNCHVLGPVYILCT